MLPAKQGVRGLEKDRPARLEADDSKNWASGPEFLPITIASRGSERCGRAKGGAAPGGTKPKTEEPPKRPTLGLR